MSEKKTEKKKYNIKLVHTHLGEDIVADVEEKKDSVLLTNPIVIGMVGRAGPPQVAASPWLLFSTETFVDLDRSFIMYIKEPVQQLRDEWQRIFNPSQIIQLSGDNKVVVPELKVK